jgi:hypothetical protein
MCCNNESEGFAESVPCSCNLEWNIYTERLCEIKGYAWQFRETLQTLEVMPVPWTSKAGTSLTRWPVHALYLTFYLRPSSSSHAVKFAAITKSLLTLCKHRAVERFSTFHSRHHQPLAAWQRCAYVSRSPGLQVLLLSQLLRPFLNLILQTRIVLLRSTCRAHLAPVTNSHNNNFKYSDRRTTFGKIKGTSLSYFGEHRAIAHVWQDRILQKWWAGSAAQNRGNRVCWTGGLRQNKCH